MKLADIFDIAEDARRLGRPYDDVLALAGDAAPWFDVLRPRENAPLRMQSMWAKLGFGEPAHIWEMQENALICDLNVMATSTWSSAVRFGQEAAMPPTSLPAIESVLVLGPSEVNHYTPEAVQSYGEWLAKTLADGTLTAGT